MELEDIYKKFSPKMNEENTGEKIHKKKKITIPIKPQADLDLHGKTLIETQLLVDYFIEESIKKELIKIRIITGVGKHSPFGKSVLFEEVEKKLIENSLDFKKENGFFDILLINNL